jgi:hypothetical protein
MRIPLREWVASKWFCYAGIAIFILMHIYNISAPPNGYHQWRESDTAAVIANYYQEDPNILHPRVNQRGAGTGINGMEFPIYQYSSALLYFVFGPNHAFPRILTLLAACFALFLLYRVVSEISGPFVGALALWALAFSPLFFFYSYKIMPDIWMLCFLLGAVFLFIRYMKNGKIVILGASALCLVISATIKPLGLPIYLPFLYLLYERRKELKPNYLLIPVYIALTIALVFLWFKYARWVSQVNRGGSFYLGGRLGDFAQYLFAPQFYKKLILQWPFEIWIGWVLVIPFIIGIYKSIKNKSGKFYFLWILGAFLIFAVTAEKSSTHDYYTLVILPPLAALTGIGLGRLLDKEGWLQKFAIALLIMSIPMAFIRVHERIKKVPEFGAIRAMSESTIAPTSLVMVEDDTPAIYLYQLNRKGWSLRSGVKHEEVKNLIKQGAEYLILKRSIEEYSDSLAFMFEGSPVLMGPLYCYKAMVPK